MTKQETALIVGVGGGLSASLARLFASQGMSIALYTTLLGAALNVWLNINHRVLSTGTVNLISEIVAYGEKR